MTGCAPRQGRELLAAPLSGRQPALSDTASSAPTRSSGSQPRAASSSSYCCQQRALGLGQGWGCEEPPSGSAARTALPPSPALRAYVHLGRLLASPTFKAASISPSPARAAFLNKKRGRTGAHGEEARRTPGNFSPVPHGHPPAPGYLQLRAGGAPAAGAAPGPFPPARRCRYAPAALLMDGGGGGVQGAETPRRTRV